MFSFHHVGSGDRTQVVRLGSKYLYPENHLAHPGPAFYIGLQKLSGAGWSKFCPEYEVVLSAARCVSGLAGRPFWARDGCPVLPTSLRV